MEEEGKIKNKWIPLILNDDWSDVSNVSKKIEEMGIKVEPVGGYSIIFRSDDSGEVSKKLSKAYGSDHHFTFFLPTDKKTALSICFREEIKKCKKDLLYSIYTSIRTLKDNV